jgi:hypothetical protein
VSTTNPMSTRKKLVGGGVVVAALVVLALLGALVLGNRADEVPVDRDASAATSVAPSPTSAAPSATPAPAVPEPIAPVADGAPVELPPVPLDGRAEADSGVVALLPRIEAIEGSGSGPGNIAGPALRVTVRLENGSSDALFLDGVAVNVYYGDERTPASPLDDPSSAPFQGSLAAGDDAEGVYVVRVPEGARGNVTVEVGYQAGAPLLMFNGPVA